MLWDSFGLSNPIDLFSMGCVFRYSRSASMTIATIGTLVTSLRFLRSSIKFAGIWTCSVHFIHYIIPHFTTDCNINVVKRVQCVTLCAIVYIQLRSTGGFEGPPGIKWTNLRHRTIAAVPYRDLRDPKMIGSGPGSRQKYFAGRAFCACFMPQSVRHGLPRCGNPQFAADCKDKIVESGRRTA